jgi:hypothetical protein
MITSHGYGLIVELIAAALLIAALTGLFVQRSKPWLLGATMAFVILTMAAIVVIASSLSSAKKEATAAGSGGRSLVRVVIFGRQHEGS